MGTFFSNLPLVEYKYPTPKNAPIQTEYKNNEIENWAPKNIPSAVKTYGSASPIIGLSKYLPRK